MPIREVEEILKKYSEDENRIESLMSTRSRSDTPLPEEKPYSATLSLDEVIVRNKQIMKDLENAKANLRSKAIFSPYEMEWENIYANYNKSVSMPVITYKCKMPVFV